jgi:hypothetical protein
MKFLEGELCLYVRERVEAFVCELTVISNIRWNRPSCAMIGVWVINNLSAHVARLYSSNKFNRSPLNFATARIEALWIDNVSSPDPFLSTSTNISVNLSSL